MRTVTSDRARTSSSTRALWCRCRPHLKQTFDFKTSNLPVLFMRKSKDLKGWFVYNHEALAILVKRFAYPCLCVDLSLKFPFCC